MKLKKKIIFMLFTNFKKNNITLIFMIKKNYKFSLSIFFILIVYSTVKSETLSEVLKDAYNFYPDVTKSLYELETKQLELKKSKTDFLPSVDLTLSQGRNITKSLPDTNMNNFNTLNPSSVDLKVSQPLGSTKFLNLKEANNNFEIGKYENKSTVQNILYRASIAYYNLLKIRFLLDVAIKNEKNLEQKLNATEKRFEFRDVTKTDVFQAKARLASAKSKRIEEENNLEIAISEFKSVVGREPNLNWYTSNKDKITSSNPIDWAKFGELPKLPFSIKESKKLALKNNPDIVTLKYKLKNSEINITKDKLEFMPELSISANYGKDLESTRTINRKDSYEITAEMSIPIFNKGHNFYDVEKSKNSSMAVLEQLESLKIDTIHEVNSAWKKILSLKSSIESLKVSVKSNEVALDGVTKEAGVGTRTTLNILDAEKELTQSEADLINARFELITASYDLLKTCGLLSLSYLITN